MMNMKNTVTLIIILLSNCFLYAQHARFVTSGKIEFEKTINMYAVKRQVVGNNPSIQEQQDYDQYKTTHAQFKKMNSTLIFGDGKSLFTPEESIDNNLSFGQDVMGMQFNTIYNDMTSHLTTIQKNIYGSQFLLKDTTRKIKWKITGETRDIAGYTCRRANGVISDSIYVVAFYTDKIRVGSGPESFNGLPGIILGVVLPHENVTWYATKITDMAIAPATIIPPKKGKVLTTWGDMKEVIRKSNNTLNVTAFYRRKVFGL
jgi:GLPGLI family protein